MGYADFLRKVPLFAELPDADLERLCSMIKEVNLAPGETLFAEGDPGEEAYVIAEGEIEIVKVSSGRDVLLAVRDVGRRDRRGGAAREAPRSATARARGACKLLAIHKTLLDELVQGERLGGAGHVLHGAGALARDRGDAAPVGEDGPARHADGGRRARAQQPGRRRPARRRPARRRARGSAGRRARAGAPLAHAAFARHDRAAARRASARAPAARRSRRARARRSRGGGRGLARRARGAGRGRARADAGDARLRHREAGARWRPTSAPATAGRRRAGWRRRTLVCEPPRRGRAGRRAASPRSSRRSRATPTSIRRPCRRSTSTRGIDSTLVILRHKLKAGIDVRREYAPDLPRISAWGSELNQVWTNILDNAADALADRDQGRQRRDHDPHAARGRLRRRRDRATTAPASRPRSRTGSSRRSSRPSRPARGRASASTSATGSSCTGTAAISASARGRARRRSRSGCRSTRAADRGQGAGAERGAAAQRRRAHEASSTGVQDDRRRRPVEQAGPARLPGPRVPQGARLPRSSR